MTQKKTTFALILVSLIAALAILLAAKFGGESAQTVIFIIIAIWWVPFSFLAVRNSGKQAPDGTSDKEN